MRSYVSFIMLLLLFIQGQAFAQSVRIGSEAIVPEPGEPIAGIERLDDFTVRVAEDIISFNFNSPYAEDADFVVDVSAMHPE